MCCLSFVLLNACAPSDNPTVSETTTEPNTSPTDFSDEQQTEINTTICLATTPTESIQEYSDIFVFEDVIIHLEPDWIVEKNNGYRACLRINNNLECEIHRTYNVLPLSNHDFVLNPDNYLSFQAPDYSIINNRNGAEFLENIISEGHINYKFFCNNNVYSINFESITENDKETINLFLNNTEFDEGNPNLISEPTVPFELSFQGSGDTVTKTFTANGCTKIKGEYNGDSAFFVTLYDSEGNSKGMIFSNMGQYSGEKVFKFENDTEYMFEVTAREGDWEIAVE